MSELHVSLKVYSKTINHLKLISQNIYLAGHWEAHGSMLHSWHSVNSPTQSKPPNWGAGLSHLRDLVWPPPPQDTEHSVQSSHSLKAPSTRKLEVYK